MIIQAGQSERGRAFSARWGEVVFVSTYPSLDAGKRSYAAFKDQVAALGRDRVMEASGIRNPTMRDFIKFSNRARPRNPFVGGPKDVARTPWAPDPASQQLEVLKYRRHSYHGKAD